MTEGHTHVIKFPQFPPSPPIVLNPQVHLDVPPESILNLSTSHCLLYDNHSKRPSSHPFFGSHLLYSDPKQSTFNPVAIVMF